MKIFNAFLLAIGTFVLAAMTGVAAPGDLSCWKPLAEGGANVEIAQVSGSQDTNALRISVQQLGERSGIVCADMGDTKLQPGQWYDFSFNARSDSRKTFALTVSLESKDGKVVSARTTLPEVGHDAWGRYTVALHIRQPVSKCRMVIAMADTGTIVLSDLSVVLRQPFSPH